MAAKSTPELHLLPTQAAAIISAVDDPLPGFRLGDWPHFARGLAEFMSSRGHC